MSARDPKTYAIIGAAMKVHGELGPGFLEAVYHDALAIELDQLDISFGQEVELPIFYRDIKIKSKYKADFICFDRYVLLEIKAIKSLSQVEDAQIINYLKATKVPVGLLINFGVGSLQFKRFIYDKDTNKVSNEIN